MTERLHIGTHRGLLPGSPPAVFAFVLIDAEPVEKGGKKLTTHYPTRLPAASSWRSA
jgi:hypothetical protein